MNTNDPGFFDCLTERVLGAILEVSNTLGTGFLEKVYERALVRELRLRDILFCIRARLQPCRESRRAVGFSLWQSFLRLDPEG